MKVYINGTKDEINNQRDGLQDRYDIKIRKIKDVCA
jgi:hypothetical protein